MKIYYATWKRMRWAAIIGILSAMLLWMGIYYHGNVAAVGEAGPIYQGVTGQKAVAVTVNVDWGGEYIPAMLDAFAKNDARVTFFVTGKWAENNPQLMKTMTDAGHSIQNHGYQHVHFNSLGADQVATQIKQAEDVIFKTTSRKTRFFAPPYGEKSRPLVSAVLGTGYQYVMWSVDTIDWQKPAPEVIVQRVMKKVHNDAIILMHPTEPTVRALPELLTGLKAQGYKMVSIEEIMAAPGSPAQ